MKIGGWCDFTHRCDFAHRCATAHFDEFHRRHRNSRQMTLKKKLSGDIELLPPPNYNLGPGRAEENLADLVDICLNKIIKIAL